MGGHLAPGTPIRDAELASRLGTSIIPVRASVAVLISEGLIEVLPNKRRRVTILTQRMAQELMDVVALVVSASLERMPSDRAERSAVAVACRAFADQMRQGDRPNSQFLFQRFVERLLQATGNDELIRMAEPVTRRAIDVVRLYPSEHLYGLWGRTFHRVADLIVTNPTAVAALVREFTVELLTPMSRDRPPTAEVHLTAARSGTASTTAGETPDTKPGV